MVDEEAGVWMRRRRGRRGGRREGWASSQGTPKLESERDLFLMRPDDDNDPAVVVRWKRECSACLRYEHVSHLNE